MERWVHCSIRRHFRGLLYSGENPCARFLCPVDSSPPLHTARFLFKKPDIGGGNGPEITSPGLGLSGRRGRRFTTGFFRAGIAGPAESPIHLCKIRSERRAHFQRAFRSADRACLGYLFEVENYLGKLVTATFTFVVRYGHVLPPSILSTYVTERVETTALRFRDRSNTENSQAYHCSSEVPSPFPPSDSRIRSINVAFSTSNRAVILSLFFHLGSRSSTSRFAANSMSVS
jgi:hypothetical protein